MSVTAQAPGLSYVAVPPPDPKSPLRTDVAGFIGRTRRGPVGTLTRVTGWRGYLAAFGDVVPGPYTPYAVRGYFNNGGQVAHVLRLAAPGTTAASGTLTVGTFDKTTQAWLPNTISSQQFGTEQYRVDAKTPGAWAVGGKVKTRFRRQGSRNKPEVDLTVIVPGEPTEYFTGIGPADLRDTINAQSNLITLTPIGPVPAPLDPNKPGPIERQLAEVSLSGGSDGQLPAGSPDEAADRIAYAETQLAAAQAINDEEEVALVVVADLYNDAWLDDGRVDDVVGALLGEAAALHDRLVLLDAPPSSPPLTVAQLADLADHYRAVAGDAQTARAGAFYHPWLEIPLDPVPNPLDPFLRLPPSGHVAGVISRLDRERGAHHTPANAPVIEAEDVVPRLDGDEQAVLHPAGVNLVRCLPGRGIMVWGSRTLDLGDAGDLRDGRFIAHRRLVHRLVRAARRVAEPLVFEVNGPELWLTLVRAITSVLLEAYRAGALQGERPEEAFFVKCDAQTNTQDDIDNGQCICEVGVAPAKPMEFIVLKVALLANGTLDIVENEASQ